MKEGDSVKENQPLVEIMTDKVNVEIPFPKQGTIQKLMAKEGEVVKVGQALLSIEEKAGQLSIPGSERTPIATKPSPPTPAKTPTTVRPQEAPLTTPPQASRKPEEVLATPATRKLCERSWSRPNCCPGNWPRGPNYRRGRATVQTARESSRGCNRDYLWPRGVEERVPLRGIRRKVAEHMLKSKNATAQVTHVDEVDMTEVVHLRERAKPSAEKRGVKLTYLPFVMKALIPALKQYPYLNSSLDDEKRGDSAQEILQHWNSNRY